MLTTFLQAVSLIFEPFLVGFLAIVAVIFTSGESFSSSIFWLVLSVVVAGLPPLLVLIYEKRKGMISDWFIVKREERRDVQLAWSGGSLLLTAGVYLLAGPRVLLAVSLDLFILALLFTLINLRLKISIHASVVTLLVLCLLLFGSLEFYPAILLIPLVAYSRWYLHKHTLTQLTTAVLLTLVVTLAVFRVFGLVVF